MHRNWLLNKLQNYEPFSSPEIDTRAEIVNFIKTSPDCFKRENLAGHITGSAWILSPDFNHTLLTLHKKLKKWLQIGGHSDGHPNTLEVALREALEESGLEEIRPISEEIFHIDIHSIPAHKKEPKHFHYDIRFLFIADPLSPLSRQIEESDQLAWIPVSEIKDYSQEKSLLTMAKKTQSLLDFLKLTQS